MLSVSIFTLGCKLNQLESEALADSFRRAGFSLLQWEEPCAGAGPDILIVNTCTVTSRADQKARRVIRKALHDNPSSCVIVTGCYASLDREKIEALGEGGGRLLVAGEKARLLELPPFLGEALNGEALNGERPQAGGVGELVSRWLQDCASRQESAFFQPGSFEPSSFQSDAFRFTPQKFSFHTRAFIKIQDGCDKHCTYCRIRLARGPSRSMDAKKVLEELQALEAGGFWEAVLTGVNIGQYRDPCGPESLGALLEYLLYGTRSIGLRLSSLEPEGIDEGLAAVLSRPRIRPHFHLSVQSGSGAVLKKMGRSYSGETVERAAALLRSARDKPFLACDIIAGFPGETEDDFNQTLSLCRKIEFAWIHAFPYSKRPGTPAFSCPLTVSERETGRRVGLLTDLAWHGRSNYVRGCIGAKVEALVEKQEKKDGYCRGLTDNYLRLLIKPSGTISPEPGAVLRCRICGPAQYPWQEEAGYDAKADEIL